MKTSIIELAKAVIPPLLISAWTYIFWTPIQQNWTFLGPADVAVPIFVLLFAAIIDLTITVRKRISWIIVGSYLLSIFIFCVCLSVGSEVFLSSGSLGIYTLCAFVATRYAAQVFETSSWHWGKAEGSSVGLAVTSVLVDVVGDPCFILVRNSNLNGGRGVWVSPGGRWKVGAEKPEHRLLNKIAEEVNVVAHIDEYMPWREIMPDLSAMDTRECIWMAPPHFVLLETLGSTRTDFSDQHLDLVYVCTTTGVAAGKAPKYGAEAQLRVPLAACEANFNAARMALLQAAEMWDIRNGGAASGRRDDISSDVAWRMYLVAASKAGVVGATEGK